MHALMPTCLYHSGLLTFFNGRFHPDHSPEEITFQFDGSPIRLVFKSLLINDTHREKLFYLVSTRNGWLAASDLFRMFTQSFKFYTFYYQEYRCLENLIYQTVKMNVSPFSKF